jgi:thiol-disulfide isomerase/thioredoxin
VQVSLAFDNHIKPDKSDGRVSFNSDLAEGKDAVTTDAQGHWRIENVPNHPELELSLFVTHTQFVSDQYWQDSQKASGVTTAMLLRETATLTLKRGVFVEGRVSDKNGNPIKDALIIHGDDPYFAQPKSDFPVAADGRFKLPALPPRETNLTVIAPGWAPEMRRVQVKAGMPPQYFRMVPGRPIRLRIVDTAGKPMPNAEVVLSEWRGIKSLHNHHHPNVHDTKIPRNSDSNGIWEWTWAPATPVKLNVGWIGHAPVPLEVVGGEPARTVILKAEHRVSGRVLDAITNQPIPAFTVIPVDVFRKDFLHAERNNGKECMAGQLNFLATRTDISLRLRVEAPGYRTQDGPEFKVGDDAARIQDFRLQPSQPVAGTIVDSGGQPVANAEVLLATPTQNIDLSFDRGNQRAATSAEGRFAFPDPGEPWAVLARGNAGYAIAEFSAGQRDAGTLRLKPWASVRGQFRDGGLPVRNARILLQPIRALGLGPPRIDATLQTITGPDGRFEFPKVPPVPISVRVYIGPWKAEEFRSGPSVPLDLQPGEHVDLDLGGKGAILTGTVILTGNVPADLDCTYSLNYLVRRDGGITPPSAIRDFGFDVRRGWRENWAKTNEGLAYLGTLRYWFVKLAPDGSFRVCGVPQGEYDLAVEIYSKPSGCLVDPIARKVVRVTVTEADVARGEMTLPEIAAPVVPVAAVGDEPNFPFARADNSSGTLADYRGRYTVLHFWASWCEPCRAQLPALRRLQERFSPRGLSLLSLSLDEDPAAWEKAVQHHALGWPQGRIASNSNTGISSVPAYWLLDPSGKIVTKVNDPDDLATALGDRLK